MQNRGNPRFPAIDPVFLMYGNTKMYERKMRAFQFTWRHFFMAIHAKIRRSECRAAIVVLCMYGVYDTEILLAPSSINFNPQPTLSGASRYAVRSCPYADRSSLTHLIWYVKSLHQMHWLLINLHATITDPSTLSSLLNHVCHISSLTSTSNKIIHLSY